MNWTENAIRNIVPDLASENLLACRALLDISNIEFTEDVSSMAVSLGEKPVLKINLDFCKQNLQTEDEVKCILLHEFLHVLLQHTIKYEVSNPILNVALDAVINAIIYRTKGMTYAGFFARYYNWEPISLLLRPAPPDLEYSDSKWEKIHKRLYDHGHSADDLYEYLLNEIKCDNTINLNGVKLLGNHDSQQRPSGGINKILDDILKKMDGTGIWSKAQVKGTGDHLINNELIVKEYRIRRWKKRIAEILRHVFVPFKRFGKDFEEQEFLMPVLSSKDRRSFLKFQNGGIIPFSVHESDRPKQNQLVNIYLDVSGSMAGQLDFLISALYEFRDQISWPMMVFSDQVAPVRFVEKKLLIKSTEGTNINCVFDDIREKKIKRALVITDGFVGSITAHKIREIQKKDLWFLISPKGSCDDISHAGFPYRILPDIDWKK